MAVWIRRLAVVASAASLVLALAGLAMVAVMYEAHIVQTVMNCSAMSANCSSWHSEAVPKHFLLVQSLLPSAAGHCLTIVASLMSLLSVERSLTICLQITGLVWLAISDGLLCKALATTRSPSTTLDLKEIGYFFVGITLFTTYFLLLSTIILLSGKERPASCRRSEPRPETSRPRIPPRPPWARKPSYMMSLGESGSGRTSAGPRKFFGSSDEVAYRIGGRESVRPMLDVVMQTRPPHKIWSSAQTNRDRLSATSSTSRNSTLERMQKIRRPVRFRLIHCV